MQLTETINNFMGKYLRVIRVKVSTMSINNVTVQSQFFLVRLSKCGTHFVR